jgi:hypothetical protein
MTLVQMQGGRGMLAARRSAWDAAFNALFMQLRNGATDAFYCISPQVSCLPHITCMAAVVQRTPDPNNQRF